MTVHFAQQHDSGKSKRAVEHRFCSRFRYSVAAETNVIVIEGSGYHNHSLQRRYCKWKSNSLSTHKKVKDNVFGKWKARIEKSKQHFVTRPSKETSRIIWQGRRMKTRTRNQYKLKQNRPVKQNRSLKEVLSDVVSPHSVPEMKYKTKRRLRQRSFSCAPLLYASLFGATFLYIMSFCLLCCLHAAKKKILTWNECVCDNSRCDSSCLKKWMCR